MSPGTAYVLMHHSVGDEAGGKVSSWGQPVGGMGAVADACRSAAESFGAEIRVNAGVSTGDRAQRSRHRCRARGR